MPIDHTEHAARDQVAEQLAKARRQLREQEQTLARLNYEWGISKRLRTQAPSEDEREQWRIQSDVYMGLVLQQETVIEEIKESIERHRTRLTELDTQLSDETDQ
jgi:hypothetical protein